MNFSKKTSKYKFEMTLSKVQLLGIAVWSSLLLLIPIGIDQFITYKENVHASSETQENVAGIFTEEENFFTYTIDLREEKELISALTLVVGSLSTIAAAMTGVYFIKDSKAKSRSVFIN